MMQIIDGKAIAKTIRENVKTRTQALERTPGLAILLVGDDPASHVYVNLKQKACEEAGIHFEKFVYDSDVTTESLIEKVHELNIRDDIDGVLVQLPLPSQDENAVIAAIDPKKDVDGFHPENQKLLEEDKPCLAPATALGIVKLIDSTEEDLSDRKAVVIGSELFTRPIRKLLEERKVTTDRLDPKTLNPSETLEYDIVIPVVGKPELVTKDMIKDGTIVIDVGTTRVEDHIVGDVDAKVQNQKTGWITPVPGGVGPMTVAMLLVNVLKAYHSH